MSTQHKVVMPEIAALIKEHGLQVVLRCVLDVVRPDLALDHPSTMALLDQALDHYSDRLTRDTLSR